MKNLFFAETDETVVSYSEHPKWNQILYTNARNNFNNTEKYNDLARNIAEIFNN